MFSPSAPTSQAPIDHDWEIVNEPVWPIHKQPAEELRIALQEANPDRARTAIDRLRDLTDRQEIDGARCLQHLLDALGDSDLSRANPAAAPYVAALVSLKIIMPLKCFPGRRPWPEEQVARTLGASMPTLAGQTLSPMSRTHAAATDRWIGRVETFMTAGLVSKERGFALIRDSQAPRPMARQARLP